MDKLCPQGHAFRGSRCKECMQPPRKHEITYGWRWDCLSRRYRIDNPLCEDCEKNGRVEPSREVHHIVPLSVDPSLKYELSNLVALCKGCHAIRHRNMDSSDNTPAS